MQRKVTLIVITSPHSLGVAELLEESIFFVFLEWGNLRSLDAVQCFFTRKLAWDDSQMLVKTNAIRLQKGSST